MADIRGAVIHALGTSAPSRRIDMGEVVDPTLPPSEVAEAHRAMHERRAIKVLLQP